MTTPKPEISDSTATNDFEVPSPPTIDLASINVETETPTTGDDTVAQEEPTTESDPVFVDSAPDVEPEKEENTTTDPPTIDDLKTVFVDDVPTPDEPETVMDPFTGAKLKPQVDPNTGKVVAPKVTREALIQSQLEADDESFEEIIEEEVVNFQVDEEEPAAPTIDQSRVMPTIQPTNAQQTSNQPPWDANRKTVDGVPPGFHDVPITAPINVGELLPDQAANPRQAFAHSMLQNGNATKPYVPQEDRIQDMATKRQQEEAGFAQIQKDQQASLMPTIFPNHTAPQPSDLKDGGFDRLPDATTAPVVSKTGGNTVSEDANLIFAKLLERLESVADRLAPNQATASPIHHGLPHITSIPSPATVHAMYPTQPTYVSAPQVPFVQQQQPQMAFSQQPQIIVVQAPPQQPAFFGMQMPQFGGYPRYW